ncbi:inner-membrane translocator [Brachyspira pilosicoli B2904]|uniref:Inner-membrane translocator n=1 Tax=Brachyspira pilosicoli B2904 TaxID=1133568 RepID=J9USA3_BRAPL|nr:ABC transporter permease [Brachyspira pilosicoli]AFR71720.1 inner-membrane translocator [Brachyspira pilosicoli B2904]
MYKKYINLLSNKYINVLFTIIISMLIGAIIILIMGHNPIEAYIQLFRASFVGKLNLGTTLEKFVPLFLTALAFAVSSKVGIFNVGVEGELYLGAIVTAWAGVYFSFLPFPIHFLVCVIFAVIVGSAWASIPAILKAYWKVNEICVTILMNYVAIYITSYLVNGPLSAKTGVARTLDVAKDITLMQFMKPSRANLGIIIAILITILIFFILNKTTLGYRIKTVGLNEMHADYVGIDSKKTIIFTMMFSGAIGGIAGLIEVLGVYGYFLDNFSASLAFDGMLAALIVKNDFKMLPFISLFLAALKSGALGMERYTGIPKSLVDTIIAIFIIFATMEILISFVNKLKNKKAKKLEA